MTTKVRAVLLAQTSIFFLLLRFYTGRKSFTNKNCLFYAKFFEFEQFSIVPFFLVASSLSMLWESSNTNMLKNHENITINFDLMKNCCKLFHFWCLKPVIFWMKFIIMDHCEMTRAVTKSTMQFLTAYKAVTVDNFNSCRRQNQLYPLISLFWWANAGWSIRV